MKLSRFLLAVPAIAAAMTAVALLNSPAFDSFKSTLNKAEGVSADVVMTGTSGTQKYSIALAKPDKLRLDTASKLVVADGNEVTTFVKKDNYYYTEPQTEHSISELLSGVEYQMWTPFYDKDSFAKVARVRKSGERKIKGESFSVVEVMADSKGETKMEFYLSEETNLPGRMAITVQSLRGTDTTVVSTENVELSTPAADLFAFAAPSGAKKVDLSTLELGKWIWDLDKALEIAKAGDKLIMVDFMATWCGPCKMMEAQVFETDEFKKATKDMVLLKVDVDKSPAIAQKYGVTAMPTVKFLNAQGEIVHEFVGYGGYSQVMSDIQTAQSKATN